jgi:ribonuclease HII
VFAAAVVLPPDYDVSGLNDSKRLTAKRRETLFDEIRAGAVCYGVASATVEEIEALNILEAALLAMRRAVERLDPPPEKLLIDGNIARGFPIPAEALVGGDAREPCIMAASILAKVSRDRELLALDAQYPGYGFAKHKGYGTKAHIDAIRELGPCPAHRRLFLRKLEAGPRVSGERGEEQACAYLEHKGYEILERRFRVRRGEIDIVARKGDITALVEVKLRRTNSFGGAWAAVTAAKQKKLRAAANLWLSRQRGEPNVRFDVVEVYAPQGIEGRLEFVHWEGAF